MKFFLMQGERNWNTMKYAWLPPVLVDKNGSPSSILPKKKWNKLDNEGSETNVIALCYIFSMGLVLMSFIGLPHVDRLKRLRTFF